MNLIALLLHNLVVSALDASRYPLPNLIPAVNQAWMAKIPSTIPDTPLSAPVNADWTSDITSCKQKNHLAFTFDDGPSESTTPLLAELEKRKIKATFFVVGGQVLQYPDVLLKAYQAGHQIGIHTWSHPYLTTLKNEQIVAEIMWTSNIIQEVLGFTPVYFRPPYGDVDNRVRQVVAALGLTTIIWNKDTLDASDANANVSAAFQSWMQDQVGIISLEHDLTNQTAAKAPAAMDIVLQSSYQPVVMSVCLGETLPSKPLVGSNPASPVAQTQSSGADKPLIVLGLLILIFTQ